MKIALVDPPHQAFMGYRRFYFPLGLVSVGTVLKSRGHEVKIFDEEYRPEGQCLSNAVASGRFGEYYKALQNPQHPIWKTLCERLLAFRPDVVGITVLSCKYDSALFVARMVRTLLPETKVMVGGDHTVACAWDLIANGDIDAVAVGEGEETACELIDAWEHHDSLRSISGLAFKEEGHPVVNKRRPLIENLDSLPMPDRSLLNNLHSYTPLDMGLMMTSRGCTQKCTFCGIAASLGRRERFRSIAACLRELIHTRDTYGTTYFSFRDGTFTSNRARTEEFCRAMIAHKLGITWECLTRADCVDHALLDLMVKAGCVQIRIGIESGSPRILRYLHKEESVEDYERAAKLLNACGIYWSAYVMLGLPEETLEDMQMTFTLLERLRASFITVSRFVPLPGTALYKDIVRAGGHIDWRHQNSMCLYQSYSRHISAPNLERIAQAAFEFAEQYNASNVSPRWHDRRIIQSKPEGPRPFDGQGRHIAPSCIESPRLRIGHGL